MMSLNANRCAGSTAVSAPVGCEMPQRPRRLERRTKIWYHGENFSPWRPCGQARGGFASARPHPASSDRNGHKHR
jgi:hypothetical protein